MEDRLLHKKRTIKFFKSLKCTIFEARALDNEVNPSEVVTTNKDKERARSPCNRNHCFS